MHTSLVANLNHARQRLVESGLNAANYCIFGLIGEVRRIEIGEVVIPDPVVDPDMASLCSS
jgi:hypothetical protein